MITIWSGQAGRRYPQGQAQSSTVWRQPNDGTSSSPVSSIPPSQSLSIGLGLDLRGGVA